MRCLYIAESKGLNLNFLTIEYFYRILFLGKLGLIKCSFTSYEL